MRRKWRSVAYYRKNNKFQLKYQFHITGGKENLISLPPKLILLTATSGKGDE